MKSRFWLFKRRNTYYVQDVLSGKQESLHTKDKREAERLRQAKNDVVKNPMLGLALGRAYLSAHDPKIVERTWSDVMAEIMTHGCEATRNRCERAMRSKALSAIRRRVLIETTSQDLLLLLRQANVSTNHYMRRLHNLALGLGWLPWPILASKLWPSIQPKSKRAVTSSEHKQIISAEKNAEQRLYYDLLWETGASQTDAASLSAEDIDWATQTLSYRRRKTGEMANLMIGSRLSTILKRLPSRGLLFPNLSQKRDTHRSSEFRRRCRLLGIEGVTLHSYRYAWAERARTCGYPERFAQQALGHNSKAVHRAYARKAEVRVPSMEDYERASYERKIIPIQLQKGDAVESPPYKATATPR